MPSQAGRAAWIAALDELDAEVVRIETLLVDEHRMKELPEVDLWSPPPDVGPLPQDLRRRADEILTRQRRAARELTVAITVNRRHAAFLTRVEGGDAGTSPPVYLDCAM